MSISSIFFRFSVVYFVVMASLGLVAGMLEIEKADSLNTPIILAISYWCFHSYSTKNARVIEKSEKWKLVFTALVGDVLVTLLLGVPTMIANEIPLQYLSIGLAVMIPLHLLFFIGIEFGVRKKLLKQNSEWAPG